MKAESQVPMRPSFIIDTLKSNGYDASNRLSTMAEFFSTPIPRHVVVRPMNPTQFFATIPRRE